MWHLTSELFLVQQRNKNPCVVSYCCQPFKNYAFEHSKIFSEDDNSSRKNACASTCTHTDRRKLTWKIPLIYSFHPCVCAYKA